MIAVPAGALAVWWLLQPGDLPDQVMRAAAVMTATAFALASRRDDLTFTHRALLAVALAAAGVAAGFLLFGWSWSRLHWWVAFRTGAALRLVLSPTVMGSDPGVVDLDRPDFDEVLNDLVQTSADLFPAALALQLFVSLVVAVVVARRLTGVPVGRPLGKLVDFRFSEHLGWLLAAAVVVLLVPALGGARPVAMNVLMVMAVLYGLRGIAVVVSGLRVAGAGPILYGVAAVAVFFLLPGTVLLGVLDAGLNLRRRRLPRSGA
ncbi:MAG: DUF2232 domain-containing protein [Actinomycetota bacterium]|nr:DUF2232 domain-containing protein [Actinomycetota bacterium]